MSRELPANPNLEHLRKQAKELLRQLRQTDARARLAGAQHALALEYGFASWPKLKLHVESLVSQAPPPEQLSQAVCASDARQVARVLARYPELKNGLNEPMFNYGDMPALLAAVQRSDRKTIDVLLGAGADIHARSLLWSGGIGVLDECAPALAPFLIERGARLDAHSAARLGMFDELRRLVTAEPSLVAASGARGETPLHCASTVEVAEFLLDRGAGIDARDLQHESTPAQHMLRVVQARHYPRDRQEIARFLVARGCSTDILMGAALGDLALVRRHLEEDPAAIRTAVSEQYFPKHDPRSGGCIYFSLFGRGRTPHMVARDFGHEDVYQFLMLHTPEDVKLAQALELGDEDAFRAFVASRPNLTGSLSDDERRRLPDAARDNNAAAVRLLLEAGWPLDARGEMHLTALQWAAWHGNAEMVREILRYHPPIDPPDCPPDFRTLNCAFHGSENGWHRDTGDYVATVEALLDAGAEAPKNSDIPEASPAVRELLIRREQG
jgi:ankyrin repeat protein